jgi:hypothetical protein
MRLNLFISLTCFAVMLLPACAPVELSEAPLGAINLTLGGDGTDPVGGTDPVQSDPSDQTDNTISEPDSPDSQADEPDQPTTPVDAEPVSDPHPDADDSRFEQLELVGSVSGEGVYEVFELGSTLAGDVWELSQATQNSRFTVVLLDEDFNMIHRGLLQPGSSFEHVIREDTGKVYAGITPAYGTTGGSYRMLAQVVSTGGVPSARQQVVYLNYEAVSGLDVNYRQDLSHSAFDASMLGSAYTGQTEIIKGIILDQMLQDYSFYNVVITTSDDGPPPAEPHSTVHFGGEGQGLLGLAENVDQYNSDAVQDAVVFVETFRIYSVMQLSTVEIGQMVANTASHELGHLLGLYHTHDSGEVMDTSANAWELTEDQIFRRAALDESVFPFGYEDTPTLLEQIVGLRPGGPLTFESSKLATQMKVSENTMREMFAIEAPHRCGNCAHPDY